MQDIIVKGAREHNLKSIDVTIPRNKISVITGLSGSGKSSLAFDTIFAEGQRRYIESLSAYARNFLEQMKKPDVDSISGLSPAIAIDQKTISSNPRSTVGTVTEVYDYLRLLYAKVGVPNCPIHHIPVESQSPQQIVEDIWKLPEGSKFFILAPVARQKKGEFSAEIQRWIKRGFTKARIDGAWVELTEAKKLARHKPHDIDLLIDRLIKKDSLLHRLKESINAALGLAQGMVSVQVVDKNPKSYSVVMACPICSFSFSELDPRSFSFNNPKGACSSCHGLGTLDLEEEEFEEGVAAEKKDHFNNSWRVKNLKALHQGDSEEESEIDERALNQCPDCHGQRLRAEALNVFVNGKNIAQLANLSHQELLDFFKTAKWSHGQSHIAEKIVLQIRERLEYLCQVGTGYLSLDRPTRTLSGGEAQRIRLASQVGSSLIGVLYVLDEPSIGLHPRDHRRLLDILENIRNRGNTVILVEHDEETIRSADRIVDLGPRAGKLGGSLMAYGAPQDIANNQQSLTGAYLSGRVKTVKNISPRKGSGEVLTLKGATGNNLKNLDLMIPLGVLCGITGVSGSGKSTLIVDTLYKALVNKLRQGSWTPAPFVSLTGESNIDKVIEINQKPIGRTPRSVPATYVGVFPLIRDLFANLPEAKIRGYKPGHFSFNVKGGRCETCQGGGQIRVEMHFLSDVFVTCSTCQGLRYSRELLSVKFKEKNIAQVLAMSIEEAMEFFKNHRLIHKKLETLHRVGLDYMTLGQSSTTLSGGESQRVKLSRELSKRATGKTLYILDEPTTGLHFDDVNKLVDLLHELVDQGNTVIVIEHNMDVIKNCDHIVDLGPEGGKAGGEIVAQGTPAEIKKAPRSVTAHYL